MGDGVDGVTNCIELAFGNSAGEEKIISMSGNDQLPDVEPTVSVDGAKVNPQPE